MNNWVLIERRKNIQIGNLEAKEERIQIPKNRVFIF
jgi:hypothetical protein